MRARRWHPPRQLGRVGVRVGHHGPGRRPLGRPTSTKPASDEAGTGTVCVILLLALVPSECHPPTHGARYPPPLPWPAAPEVDAADQDVASARASPPASWLSQSAVRPATRSRRTGLRCHCPLGSRRSRRRPQPSRARYHPRLARCRVQYLQAEAPCSRRRLVTRTCDETPSRRGCGQAGGPMLRDHGRLLGSGRRGPERRLSPSCTREAALVSRDLAGSPVWGSADALIANQLLA
jgi:hypothetical protein